MQTCIGVHHNTSVKREAPKGFWSEAGVGASGFPVHRAGTGAREFADPRVSASSGAGGAMAWQ